MLHYFSAFITSHRTITFLSRHSCVFSKPIETLTGENPEEFLFSQTLPPKHGLMIRTHSQKTSVQESAAQGDTLPASTEVIQPLPAPTYKRYFRNEPFGSVETVELENGARVTLVGCQFQGLPIANVWKLLRFSRAQALFLQVRPDQLLRNFTIMRLREDGELDEEAYCKQLLRKGFEVMPKQGLREITLQRLQDAKIVIGRVKDHDEAYYTEYIAARRKEYKQFQHHERIGNDALAVAALFAERNLLDVVLGDWPEFCFRQHVANSHTLMQLQNIFTKCAREQGMNPDIEPASPMGLAFRLFPEEFLSRSDLYMATLIQHLTSKQNGYKRVTALVGFGQSQPIRDLLLSRAAKTDLATQLCYQRVQNSIVRDLTVDELIEKHAILDVMLHGYKIIQNMTQLEFQTSYKMISIFGDVQKIDRSEIPRLRVLHYECLEKYAKVGQQEFEQGRKMLKREFFRRVYVKEELNA